MLVTRLRWVAAGTSEGVLWFDDRSRACARSEIEALDAKLREALRAAEWRGPAAVSVGKELWAWLDGDARWLQGVVSRSTAGDAWRLEIAGDLGVLSHLPWEILHDDLGFLAQRTPWFLPVRRIDDARGELSAVPLEEAPKHDLGVLFMAAAPQGQVVLDYEAEEARILDACRSDGDAHLLVEESGTLKGLGRRMGELSPRWDVVHVTCHGLDQPQTLALETDTGELDLVAPRQLQPELATASPRLLALSACLTAQRTEGTQDSFASAMAHAGMPAVLGFASKVPDDAATLFTATLYGHLGRAEPLCEALARTRYEALTADPLTDPLSMAAHPAVWGAARLFLTQAVTRLAAPEDQRDPRVLARKPDPEAFLRAMGRSIKVAPAARFVGRRRQLQALLRSLRSGKQLGAVVLGLGGVGKSSLVARALSRVSLRPVVLYQQLERAAVLRALREAYEDVPEVTGLLSDDARQRAVQAKDPFEFRALLRQVLGTGALRQRPAVFVLDDAEAQMTPGDGGWDFTEEARITLRGVVGALDGTSGTTSRVVVTGRYGFALVDDQGRDLLARLERIDLHRLDPVDARKLLRQADRYDDEGAAREVPSWGDKDLRGRVAAVGGSNARLLALLHRLLVADADRGRAALAQMEGWLRREEQRVEEPKLVEYLDNLVIEELLVLAGEDGRRLLSFLRGLEVPVPEGAVATAMGLGDEVLRRCVDLGLVERDGEGLLAVPPLVAAQVEEMEPARRRELVGAMLRALPASWRTDERGGWVGPVERASFLFRWCADVEPPEQALGRSVAARHLHWLQSEGDAGALRNETDRAGRLGIRWEGVAALAWGWSTVDGEKARALLAVATASLPDGASAGERVALLRREAALARTGGAVDEAIELLARAEAFVPGDDVRLKAILRGERADILSARGELKEALRIHREEQLPVFERLGDVRSRAVTMGKIANILSARGELEEALRIRREEELPVYERLGDVRERTVVLGRIVEAELAAGNFEAARKTLEEEVLPVWQSLANPEGVSFAHWKLGQIIIRQQQPTEALPHFERAFSLVQQLGYAGGIVQIGLEYLKLLEQTGATDRIPAVLAVVLPVAQRLRRA